MLVVPRVVVPRPAAVPSETSATPTVPLSCPAEVWTPEPRPTVMLLLDWPTKPLKDPAELADPLLLRLALSTSL